MYTFNIDKILANFDPMVEAPFKEFVQKFFRQYQLNATKKKMKHIILNMPIGAFVTEKSLDKILVDNRAVDIKALTESILNGGLLRTVLSSFKEESGQPRP